jgi:protein involved in polysaccharide export with SLBB domain
MLRFISDFVFSCVNRGVQRLSLGAGLLILLSGCSGLNQHIQGPGDFNRNYYAPEKQSHQSVESFADLANQYNAKVYASSQPYDRYGPDIFKQVPAINSKSADGLICKTPVDKPYLYQAPPLSPGDRVQIQIHEGEEFSGVYEVNLDGTLGLPLIEPVFVAGLTPPKAQQLIAQKLIDDGIFRKKFLRMSLHPQQWAAVQVQVQGAVFNPGLITINQRSAEERAQQSTQLSGDFPIRRLLNEALQSAGGIRPDANLEKVYLLRGEQQTVLNLSGLLDDSPLQLPALAAGDRIYIAPSGYFDASLVRPSSITPPGIRVFMSNLTSPSYNNSSSAINRDSTSLPYGTRLLGAAISANCVGGSAASNSNRTTILVSKNPVSGETEVIERSLEQLLVNRNRDSINPHIMPGDGVTCYDSSVTNLREIGRTLTDILLPFSLF